MPRFHSACPPETVAAAAKEQGCVIQEDAVLCQKSSLIEEPLSFCIYLYLTV